MPINAGHEYFDAEKKYLSAKTLDEKIEKLEELIRVAPKHKGAENLLAELKTRLKKLKEKEEKGKKVGKGKKGIRKEGFQVALIGKTNSGKSTLLSKLTNANPKISGGLFTTTSPELGTMHYDGIKAQIVDLPSVGSKEFDYNVVNNADCLILVVERIEDLEEVDKVLVKATGKKILAVNKIDLLDEGGKRKLNDKCRSKRLNCILISGESGEGLEELRKKIFECMGVIRVYMKEPGKEASKIPMVLKEGSCVKDVAESIYKGFSLKVRETKLTGPSGKFANQKVGLMHVLKDKDIVEFKA